MYYISSEMAGKWAICVNMNRGKDCSSPRLYDTLFEEYFMGRLN